MDLTEELRAFGRWVLVGTLGLVFLVGVLWAANPDDEGGITYRAEAPNPTVPAEPAEPSPEESPQPPSTPTPTPEETPEGPPAEELIAAAREPGGTSVQVLDAGGGRDRTRAAADALTELGYNVVNVTSARARPDATTVWFTADNEPEALALRAREDRVVEIAPNRGLTEGVDLHLLVTSDWG